MASVPTWEDTIEDAPSWDDTSPDVSEPKPRRSPEQRQADDERIRAEIEARSTPQPPAWPFAAAGALGDYVVGPIADIPRAVYNLPANVVNIVASPFTDRQIIRPLERGEVALPEVLPSLEQIQGLPLGEISELTGQPAKISQTDAGLLKGGEDLVRGLSAPEVLMSGPAGLARGALARAPAAAFGAQMTLHTPEAYSEFGRQTVEGTTAEAVRAGVGALGSSAMIAHIGGKPLPIPAEIPVRETRIPIPESHRRLGIRTLPPEAIAEPFLQPEALPLADAALREAQQLVKVPGQETAALEALRRSIEPPQIIPESIRTAERISGGGEAPYGKTSFMREAEAPTTTRTQQQIEREQQNAIQRQAETPVRNVQQPEVPQESAGKMPAAESRPQAAEARIGLPSWVREEMQRRGLSTGRIFNDIDLSNPSIRAAIESDPTLSQQQKASLLTTGALLESRPQAAEALARRAPGETTAQELMALSDAEARVFFEQNQKRGNATQNDSVLAGMKLGPEAVSELTAMRDAAQRQALDAIRAGDADGAFAGQGRVVWLNGAIEGAARKGPNFDTVSARLQQAESPKSATAKSVDIPKSETQAAGDDIIRPVQPESVPRELKRSENEPVESSPSSGGVRKGASAERVGQAMGSSPAAKRIDLPRESGTQGTRPTPEIINRINARDRRDWSKMPRGFEIDAVRAAFNDIKDLFPKKAIGQRVRASKAETFQVLRKEVQSALEKYRPDLLSKESPAAETGPTGTAASQTQTPVGEQPVKPSVGAQGKYAFLESDISESTPRIERKKRATGDDITTRVEIRAPIEVSRSENWPYVNPDHLEYVVEARGVFEARKPAKKTESVWRVWNPKTKEFLSAGMTYKDAVAFAKKEMVRRNFPPSPSTPDITTKLENLKFKPGETNPGATFAFPHPEVFKAYAKATWNTAIDIAITAIKAGRSVKEAIDAALAHLRRNATSKTDEAKVRANLEYVIEGETGSGALPPAGPRTTQSAAPAPAPKNVTLDDVYQRFEPVKKSGPSLKERGVQIVEGVRTGLASKFRPIDKLAEDIGKAYGVTTPKGISGIFEQLKGSTGKAEADIYRFDRDVSRLVKGQERDFNAYMFLRRSLDRLRQDQADITRAVAGEDVKALNRRQVAGYTIPELEAKLALLESKLGPENLRQFEQAAEGYQQYMDSALRLQVESGRMSREVYDAIKAGNEFYAPFKVMKYFEEVARPEGTGRKIDTVAEYTKAMEGIEDADFRLGDMLGAARQNLMLSRILAEKNNTMRRLAELSTFDPEGRFIIKLKPGQEAPRGMEAINVKEAGQTQQYAVNPDVAQAVQAYRGQGENIIVQMMGYAAVPLKVGATSGNIAFMVSNLMADTPRAALMSRYGVRNPADLVRYPLDFVHSIYSSVVGDVFKRDNKLFLDFLDSGAAGGTVQEHLTPGALRFNPSNLEHRSRSFAKSVLYKLPELATAIEQTSKLVGVKRAMRTHGVASGKELAKQFPEAVTEIRRFSGSPDFGRQGKWTEQARLNLLYMFFNARLQGMTADIGRLGGRDGAKTAATSWVRLASAIGLPSAYLYALNNSEEYRDDYASRPEQEKQNYWLIPKDSFITNEQGETMRDYWRIPKRESAKWMANLVESSLDFARDRSTDQFAAWSESMLEDISPINVTGETFQERMESMASSLNPLLKAPIEVASGRDLYRHRDIIPDFMQKASPENQYTERTPEVFRQLAETMPDVSPEVFRSPLMLENMTRNLTAGLITQFLPSRPLEGREGIETTPLMRRFQAVPYTDSSAFEERMRGLERESADEQVERFRSARQIMQQHGKKPLTEIIQAARATSDDPKLIERVVDLFVAEQRGITPQERRVLALPVQQRAQFLQQELEGTTPEQKSELIRNYATKRILTEAVAAELAKLRRSASAPPQ